MFKGISSQASQSISSCKSTWVHTVCVRLFEVLKQVKLTYYKKRNQNRGCLWGIVAGPLTSKEHGRTFWGDDNILYLDKGLGIQVYAFIKIHQMVHLRFVHFIVCKFYLKKNTKQNWTQDNDKHDEVFRGRCTHICKLFWIASKK